MKPKIYQNEDGGVALPGDQPTQRDLITVANKITRLRSEESALKSARRRLMVEAHGEGMTYQEIGDLLGVTKAYVHQQIKKVKEEQVD